MRLRGPAVVDDLDDLGAGVSPYEADPPLLVDADAVLAGSIASQCFEPVVGRDPQVIEGLGGIQQDKLPQGGPFDPRVELLAAFA